jgi:hypothetical protein
VTVKYLEGKVFYLQPTVEHNSGESMYCFLIFLSEYYFRIESYSCKMAGNDKQLYKRFNSEQGVKPNDRQALSPPQTGLGVSPGRCQYRYIPAEYMNLYGKR